MIFRENCGKIVSEMDFIFAFLIQWYVWVPVVAILGFLTWRNYRKAEGGIDSYDYVLLALEIPRNNDKKELAAEQLFASLHGILRDPKELRISGGIQEHLSFEIASVDEQIRFYVRVPKHLQNFVEGQIYAQYPTVQIHEASNDYAATNSGIHPVIATSELILTDNEFLPIKTFASFEVDPLAGITAALSKLNVKSEEIWVQVLVRPISDDWQGRSARYSSRLKSGAGTKSTSGFGAYLIQVLEALWKPPEATGGEKTVELSEKTKAKIAAVGEKSQKLAYAVKIRLAYLGSDQNAARIQLNAIAGAFKQFNSTNLNGFKLRETSLKREDLVNYTSRKFPETDGYILNIEELASVFHLPHTNVETPNVVWANSKTAEPPTKLPLIVGDAAKDSEISAFGVTNFRGLNQQFGIRRSDRGRHVYIIGQSGTGKSGLLELLALSDIFHNQGYAIIDPHGDFAIDNLKFVPPSRIKDVVYFNPADTAFPLGFNPMEITDPAMRNNISSEIIGVLKRMFADSWGPRLEYILRYTILALLEYPDTTMLDITRMLTDKIFREKVLNEVKDTVVLQFWRVEFSSWQDKFVAEAIAPILNKVGAFVANPIIRNIIGQPKSSFNIREMMDQGKILIVNLSKGLIGEDNASVLGSFLVTKIQLAAMSRSDISRVEDRRPFYLYVDEFQNFATDSFAVILSEARKYGLNLTVANQYVSQMPDAVRAAVFGNVGTMISMRVSPEDAPLLAQQFAPQFESQDILQMSNRSFVASMMINGEKNPAFSGTTLKLPPSQVDYLPQIIENTRQKFAKPREEIEKMIAGQITPPINLQSKSARKSFARAEKIGNVSGGKVVSPDGTAGSQNPFANLNFNSFGNSEKEAKHDESVAKFAKTNNPSMPRNPNSPQKSHSVKNSGSTLKTADLGSLIAAAAASAESAGELANENPKLFPNRAKTAENETTEAEIVLRPASSAPEFAKKQAEKAIKKSGLDKPLFSGNQRKRSRNRNKNSGQNLK